MNGAEGALAGRVLFVEGAPRSGTSLLTALLAAHPEIAATAAESHLFDSARGVGSLFDNYEGQPPYRSHLVAYLSRERLVELIRALCDGVLEEMRSHTAPNARFVVEKTPGAAVNPQLSYRRKLECYPDGWFLHVVRDPESVTRSLMRAPWSPDRSRAASRRWADGVVTAVRATLSDHPRYREITYEDLVSDPVATLDGVFGWLGLATDAQVGERVRLLSRQRFAEHVAARPRAGPRRLGQRARRAATRALARSGGVVEDEPEGAVGKAFAAALRDADTAALEALADDQMVLEVHSGDGDLRVTGAEAKDALELIDRSLFPRRFFNQSWTVVSGKSFALVQLAGVNEDGTRLDHAWMLRVDDGRIARAVLLCAGGLEPRQLKDLRLEPAAGG